MQKLQERESSNATAWRVVAAASLGLFFHFGSLLVNSFGVLLTTLCDAFQWTRGQVSLGFTLATLAAMVAMPLTGWLTDRFGARRPILVCTSVFGLLFALLSGLTPHLWHFYALFILLGLVGPGTSAVPHASLITRWFTARRGLALGTAMCGTALGGVIWPTATQQLLARSGWRATYAILGAAVLLLAMPLLWAWLKEPPTSASALPQDTARPTTTSVTTGGLTRSEALQSPVLWLLMCAYCVVSASVQACMIHLAPMLKDRGMTPDSAALAASVLGMAGMSGRLGTGWLLDLLPAVRVPMLAFSVVAAGVFLLFAGASGSTAFVAAALIGFGYGAESATIPYLVSRYFGLRAFGELYSYLFITVPLGGALGPVMMGVGFDRTGSYRLALLVCGLLTAGAALLLLRLQHYPSYQAAEQLQTAAIN